MKKKIVLKSLFGGLIITMFTSCAGVIFTASESDAIIKVDGVTKGTGSTQEIKMTNASCVKVRIEKVGYMTNAYTYCDPPSMIQFKPVTQYTTLIKDEAYDASVTTDFANKDFEEAVKDGLSEEDAWKLISQIVTNYFDNIEMADKATGYLKTSWQSQVFNSGVVRTRIIIKQSSTEPLKYKMKIVSEKSNNPKTSIKDDQAFKEWDRILRTYEEMVPEFQSRLGNK